MVNAREAEGRSLLSGRDLLDREALADDVAELAARFSNKALARAAGNLSEKAPSHWKRKANLPDLVSALNLTRASGELGSAMWRLVCAHAGRGDAEFYRSHDFASVTAHLGALAIQPGEVGQATRALLAALSRQYGEERLPAAEQLNALDGGKKPPAESLSREHQRDLFERRRA